ncbi:polysaccharide biosynthesis/export family protein [Cyanobium sp. PCC 7001]|uniref:polysaccharide biosynthesis/export family protein n=1 Tax=Cyanobium sp. PCC 7001 TaxID=180281 RepID=UPI0012EA0016|nr:polysaccharide biosynthesis/export family protein [Cyanobium sp. PCC 7001]
MSLNPLFPRQPGWQAPLRTGVCGLVLAQCALTAVPAAVRSAPQAYPMPGEASTPSVAPPSEGRPSRLEGTSVVKRQSQDPRHSGFRYRLAPGDRVRVTVFKVEGYGAETEVLSDGTINLPRIGSVNVWGMTLDEANNRITALYSAILRRPLVYIDLMAPRPVRVSLVGQVERPGFYTLSRDPSSSTLRASGPGLEGVGTVVNTSGWPTMVDALQRAGGITALGDLSNLVLVRRGNAPGEPSREYRFDYLSVLMGNGTAVNPLINDGDMIKVDKVEGVQSSEALIASAASNFAPDAISVNVVGEVVSPGVKQVKSNSPLTNAVLAAGGLDPQRAKASNIRLLRMEADGSILSRQVAFDPAAPLGSEANPPLRNGDVVVVYRNNWTRFNDTLSQAVAPLGPLLNAASLYNILTR